MSNPVFCENKLCRWHGELEHPDITQIQFESGGKLLTVKRLCIVQKTIPVRQFYFCETCANVLAMTFGK
jgi:hypothetical protein